MSLSGTIAAEPPATAERPANFRRATTLGALLLGLAGVLCALALPFAPVLVEQATVTWPSAGRAPQSTTAFFVPYEPAEMRVRVPCRVVHHGLATGERTTVFATSGTAGLAAGRALAIVADHGRLQIELHGRQIAAVVPSATGCDVRVDATATDTTVAIGSAPPLRLAGQVPQVHAFVTELAPERAQGMTVTARARNWFEAAPTGTKQALVTVHVAVMAGPLVLLWWSGRRLRGGVPSGGKRSRRPLRAVAAALAVDAGVVGILALWAVIGPMTDDDGYAMMTIRNAVHSGDIGNYYHWYNASEAPFTLWQRIIGLVAPVSLAPVWLRLPSVLAGVLTWFLVRYGLVGNLLPRHAGRLPVGLLTAMSFLAWWLPFGLGIRPEPLVALSITATFAFLLWGTRRGPARAGDTTTAQPTDGLLCLGLAALAAGLSLSVTPSGILVFAPVLVMAPRLWRVLRAGLPSGRAAIPPLAGRIAVLASLAASGITAMFWAQSLHGTLKATEVHDEIGPSHDWHEELIRYEYLLGGGGMGTAVKRVAVLLTLALLITMAALIARHSRAIPGLRHVHLPTAAVAGAFLLLWLTPSKWSHHFGAMAGLGAAFLTVATVTVVLAARRHTDQGTTAIALAGGGLTALAAGLAFSAPNIWRHWSTYDLPWTEGPVAPHGVPLPNPLFWVAVALLAAGVRALRHRRDDPWAAGRTALAASPALFTALATTASVLVMLEGFTVAPFRNPTAYTMGRQNIGHLTGSECGLPDKVEVMPDVPGGVLTPVTATGVQNAPDGPGTNRLQSKEPAGFVAQAGFPDGLPPNPAPGVGPHRFVWGSFVPRPQLNGNMITGRFTGPWFRLPALRPGQEIAVTVAGRTTGGNGLTLEFGRAGTAAPVASRALRVPAGGGWRTAALPASAVPSGSDRVRLRAVDGTTGLGGWLAFTGPRVREVMTLSDFLADRRQGPRVVAWQLAFTTPCVDDFPPVAHGLAAAPTTLLQIPGPHPLDAGILLNESEGGSLYGARATGRFSEVPSRMVGRPGVQWGRLVLIDYPFARDAYDVSLRTVRLNGWEGDR